MPLHSDVSSQLVLPFSRALQVVHAAPHSPPTCQGYFSNSIPHSSREFGLTERVMMSFRLNARMLTPLFRVVKRLTLAP